MENGNKYDPAMGHGTGGSPNDNGAQNSAGFTKQSDAALQSEMLKNNRKWANPAEKEQGFDVKKGTI